MFTTIDKFYFLPKKQRIIFAHATPRIPVSTVDAGSVKKLHNSRTLDIGYACSLMVNITENGISKPSSNPG